MRFERALTSICNRKLLQVRTFQPCQLSSSTKTAKRYKDNFIYFIIFFFFQKIKTFGVATPDKGLWKKCVILMECWSWPLFYSGNDNWISTFSDCYKGYNLCWVAAPHSKWIASLELCDKEHINDLSSYTMTQ